MQQVTFPKLLILAAATYIAWSGLCCQWFRSFRHSLRRHFHRDESHSSSLPPSPHGFHLRHHQGHDSKTMKDSSTSDYASGIWFSKSIALVDDISENPPIEFLFDEQHCQGRNNECHYEWGDVVSLKYNLQPTIDDNFATGESHYVEGSFLVSHPHHCLFSTLSTFKKSTHRVSLYGFFSRPFQHLFPVLFSI